MSDQKLSADIAISLGKTVSAQTVRKVLHTAKINGRTARKKLFIKDKKKIGKNAKRHETAYFVLIYHLNI